MCFKWSDNYFNRISDGIIATFNVTTWFYIGLSCLMFTTLAVWNANYYTGLWFTSRVSLHSVEWSGRREKKFVFWGLTGNYCNCSAFISLMYGLVFTLLPAQSDLSSPPVGLRRIPPFVRSRLTLLGEGLTPLLKFTGWLRITLVEFLEQVIVFFLDAFANK